MLAATAGVTALVSTRIYDAPPTAPTYPFILIGDSRSDPWGDFDNSGDEGVVTIRAVSNVHRGSGAVRQVCDAVRAALDKQETALTSAMGSGQAVVFEYAGMEDPQEDPDGLGWTAGVNFKVLLNH